MDEMPVIDEQKFYDNPDKNPEKSYKFVVDSLN